MDFVPHASSSAGNLYQVSHEGSHLLLDPGIPIARIRRMPGIPGLGSIDAALVSHAHLDHSFAVKDLLRARVPVLATRETLTEIGVADHHTARAVRALGPVAEIGDWKIRAFDVKHDVEGAVGFQIDAGDDRLVFATDTAYLPYKFPGTTIFALECNHSGDLLRRSKHHATLVRRIMQSHMSLERLLGCLGANDLTEVREIHLLHLSDSHGDADSFERIVQRETGIPTYAAPRGDRP